MIPNQDGLINETYWVRDREKDLAVLQRLNTAIFVPEVHEDIDAITRRLAARGLTTPVLVPTKERALWFTDEAGRVWRCLSLVGERTVHKLEHPADARSAGALVARFHGALKGMEWTFRSVRANIHNTENHMRRLRETVVRYPGHRLHAEVDALAARILEGWAIWRGATDLPGRIIHGDLKISNIRFAGEEAVAIIDLDTLAWGTLDVELGDAMRSWCNPASEDNLSPVFDLDLFEAAMEGYVQGCDGSWWPTDAEWEAVVPAVERICLELAARFAYDALEESYFGFNPRFGGRGEHNLLRARGQAALAESVRRVAEEAEQRLGRARAGFRAGSPAGP